MGIFSSAFVTDHNSVAKTLGQSTQNTLTRDFRRGEGRQSSLSRAYRLDLDPNFDISISVSGAAAAADVPGGAGGDGRRLPDGGPPLGRGPRSSSLAAALARHQTGALILQRE